MAGLTVGLAMLAPPATFASAPAATWLTQPVSGSNVLQSISCSSTTTCVAVGDVPSGGSVVVPIVSGTVGAPKVVQGAALQGVACANDSTCVAVGFRLQSSQPLVYEGVVLAITDGVPGAVQVVSGVSRLSGVSCAGPSACVAVGSRDVPTPEGVIVPITAGAPGDPLVASGTEFLEGVACPSAIECIAVGSNRSKPTDPTSPDYGVIVHIAGNLPGPVQIVSGTGYLHGVACSSGSACQAVGGTSTSSGSQGAAVSIANGIPGAVHVAPGTVFLYGVACVRSIVCQGVGSRFANPSTAPSDVGTVLTIVNGVPGDDEAVSGTLGRLFSVACLNSTTCLAVGYNASQGVVVTIPLLRRGAPATTRTTTISPDGGISGAAVAGAGAVVLLGAVTLAVLRRRRRHRG